MPDDPDAIWKPGYGGEVHYPAAAVGSAPGGSDDARQRRPRRRAGGIAVVLIVTGVAIGVAIMSRSGGEQPADAVADGEREPGQASLGDVPPTSDTVTDTPTTIPGPDLLRWAESSRPLSIPDQPVTQWTMSFAGSSGAGPSTDAGRVRAVAGSADTVVVVIGQPGVVLAIEVADGSHRWQVDASQEAIVGLDIIGGVALVRYVESDATGEVVALDLVTGAERWRRSLTSSERVLVPEDSVLLARTQSGPDGPAGVELLSPWTGEVLGSLEGTDVRIGPGSVQRYDGELVEWFDLSSLNFLGIRIHRPTDSTLDSQSSIIVEQFDDRFTVEYDAGAIGEPWEAPGRVIERWAGLRQDLLLVWDQRERVEVRGAATGELVASGEPLGWFPRPPMSRHLAGGGVVLARDEGREVVGYDMSGTVRWVLPVSPEASTHLVEGGLLIVEADAGGSRLTHLR